MLKFTCPVPDLYGGATFLYFPVRNGMHRTAIDEAVLYFYITLSLRVYSCLEKTFFLSYKKFPVKYISVRINLKE